MKKNLRRFLADRVATTSIEYSLIALGISIAIILVFNTVGIATDNNLASALGVTVTAASKN